MEDRTIADWMVTSDPSEQRAIVDDIAGRIDLALLTIPEVFRDLQPYLTSEDVPLPQISQALSLLSLVLERLQIPIDRIDVHELTTYFCERLENKDDITSFRAGVKECAKILSSLAEMQNQRFPPRDAKLVAQSVFAFNRGSNLRDQKAATRLSLLELMQTLIRLYKSNLVTNIGSKEFVEGIVAMAEFEKDPTCLNVLFPIYEVLGKQWDLGEDALVPIWDSFIRYYPIKIGGRAAASVPTPDQLKQLLLDCFISNDCYAKFAFPRLMELLDTDQDLSANVKMDVLFTIAYAISGYSASEVLKWTAQLWDSLKFEVWNGESSDTIAGTLSVITNMAKAVSNPTLDWADIENPSAKSLIAIITECNRRMTDTGPENMAKTGSILHAIAEATPYAFALVAQKFLPVIFTLWQTMSSEAAKGVILTVLNTILEARVALDEELDDKLSRERDTSPGDLRLSTHAGQTKNLLAASLVDFQRKLIDDVYFNAMTDNISSSIDGIEYRAATIRGLVVLMRIQNMLSNFEKGTIIESLNSILLQANQIDFVRNEAVSGLQKMSSTDPANFQTITLANFMAKLPKHVSTDEVQRKLELESVIYLFDSLVQIACTAICSSEEEQTDIDPQPRDRVFTAFQKAMITKLTNILEHDGQLQYANIILGAIYHGLISYDAVLDLESKSSATPKFSVRNSWHHPYAWIVLDIYKNIAKVKQLDKTLPYIGLKLTLDEDEQTVNKFVSLVGNITTLALRSGQTTAKNNFLNNVDDTGPHSSNQIWSLFVKDPPESIDTTQLDLIDGPAEKFLANVLSMSLVAGVRREDKSRLKIDVGKVALAMIMNATSTKIECSQYARISMLHFMQLLLNKFAAAKEKVGDRTLVKVMVDLIHGCEDNSNEVEVERYYQALAYFTAAALARSDPSCEVLIRLMVDGLKLPGVGRKVAQSFRILLAPSKILSEANFCAIRPLRQGRLFSLGVESIKDLWRNFSFAQHENPMATDIKTNCLIALASSLAYMDTKVYLIHVSTVLPLLLEGTNVQNDDFTKLSCIKIIQKLVPLCPGVVKVHLDSVINRMTDRTHNTYYSPSDASAACRVAAVDVLALLPKYVDNADLLKRKTKIMAELDTALNDVSMEVRLRAQKCKMAYFNLEG